MPPSRLLPVATLAVLLPACAGLESVLALRQIDWTLDRVSNVRIAGVELERAQGYGDLSATEVARVAAALSAGRLPLDLDLHLGANNPEENPEAILLGMDWTLFLRDRETVTGRLDRDVVLPSGERSEVRIEAGLDLLEFFDGGARDLVDLAASLAGAGGAPAELRLEIVPTVETRLGPIRYPRPVVLGGTVGPPGG